MGATCGALGPTVGCTVTARLASSAEALAVAMDLLERDDDDVEYPPELRQRIANRMHALRIAGRWRHSDRFHGWVRYNIDGDVVVAVYLNRSGIERVRIPGWCCPDGFERVSYGGDHVNVAAARGWADRQLQECGWSLVPSESHPPSTVDRGAR